MEVCFLSSSNSFVKNTAPPPPTHDLSVSSHKVTYYRSFFTSPNLSVKAISRRYQHRQLKKLKDTFASSSSNICCAINKPPSSNDDEIDEPSGSANGGDWRSFRAKLVAAERAPTLEQQPKDEAEDADRPLDNHHRRSPILLGERWAHPIHEPEKGCLLIATEKLDGVHIFERTVILLLSTGPIGPTGVIINRPSLMSIKESRSSRFDAGGTFSDLPLFFGGPLEEGLFLVGSSSSSSSSSDDDGNGAVGVVFDEVMKGLNYGTKESIGCAAEMVKRNTVGLDDFRFFDGYCGWDKEQLREEIRSGYWTLAACSPTVIRLSTVGTRGLWEDVLGLMGPRKVW